MDRLRDRASSATALAASLLAAAALAACASKPGPAPVPPPLPRPTIVLAAAPARLLDQNRAALRVEARISNPRGAPLAIAAAECSFALEGSPSALAAAPASADPTSVAALSEATIAFERAVDLRSLDESVRGPGGPAEASWSASARILLGSPDGSLIEAAAAAAGTIPIVREPIFRITSLRIERDVLVTTNLRLGIEVRNPNAFPLEMRSISYDFYGEGKAWASDAESSAAVIPAKGGIERGLRFTMNFADADRRLFDLVARLRTVRYRLSGSAELGTGLEAIPSFSLGFDLEGACPVEE
jgi:LEA14-like dessication related protein